MKNSEPVPPLNRRDFLRLAVALGGFSAAASFLKANTNVVSASPISEAEQSQSQINLSPVNEVLDDGRTAVAFVKSSDRADGVRRAIDLLEINPLDGKKVFLKPNFNSAHPTPGSTHIDVLRSLVLKLLEMGASGITVGDRSGMSSTSLAMRSLGVFDLAEELGFDTVVFDDLGSGDWVHMQPPESHWQNGFYMAKPCLDADVIVQTCCLKTHQYGGQFTMSLKNTVGMIAKRVPGDGHDFMNELHRSIFQREMIAEANLAYEPVLIVLDGVEAFVSGGPAKGQLVESGVVLVGTDRIAIDAVGVALLRYHGNRTAVSKGPIFGQDQIARAVELGLGVEGPDKINLLTEDEDSAEYAQSIKEILLAG